MSPVSPSRTRRPSASRWAIALLGTSILAGLATPAQAQDLHWDGTTNDFDDPANWQENQTPTPDSTIIVNNVSGAQAANSPSLEHDQSIYRTEVGTVAGAKALYFIEASQFFSGNPNDGRAHDIVGANGGLGGVHVWGGAWRSTGLDVGVAGGQGLLAADQGGRIESGEITVGRDGGNGWVSLEGASTMLAGNITMGDTNGGYGLFQTTISTAQMRDLTIINGSFEGIGSLIEAQDVRINAPQGTNATMTLNGSGLDAERLLIGGESPSANNPGSNGRGSLDARNGTLTTHSTSTIGYGGFGTVTLQDNDWHTAGDLYLGAGGGNGKLYMTGGILDGAGVVRAGAGDGSSGTISISQAARINMSGLAIGYSGGSGSLRADLVSTLNIDQGIRLGYSQSGFPGSFGEIDLLGGSQILTSNGENYIGYGDGSEGAIHIDGQQSGFHANGYVGFGSDGGRGILTLTDHASFSATAGLDVGIESGSGAVALSGGSTMHVSSLGIGINGGAGTLDADASTIDVDASVFLGANVSSTPAGTGSMHLTGGTVMTLQPGRMMTVAFGPGSTASVDIDGVGTTLTAPDYRVGTNGGSGATTIGQGGVLNADTQMILGSDANGFGRIVGNAATVNAANIALGFFGGTGQIVLTNQSHLTTNTMTIGTYAAADGYLELQDSSWNHSGALTVGSTTGNGLIDLFTTGGPMMAAIDLQGQSLRLGDGGKGVIHVDGAGTFLDLKNGGFVMGSGGGTGGLTARNGGVFTSNTGLAAGIGTGSQGVLGAVGAGSSVTLAGPVLMGSDGGHGFISASAGGSVEAGSNISTHLFGEGADSLGGVNVDSGASVILRGDAEFGGDVAGGHGIADIDGAGSLFGVYGTLDLSAGDILVANGARMFSNGANVGSRAGVTSTIVVDGAGSTWDPAGDTYIGGRYNGAGVAALAGSGSVSILNGGGLGGGNARIHVASAGGTGTLLIDMTSYAVAGTYDQGAGGTLAIGLNPNVNGQTGSLTSDGSISFASGSHISILKQVAGRYHIGDRYRIAYSMFSPIAHAGVVFDGLEQQSLFVGLVPTFEALGQGQALFIDVAQTRSFASVADTPNQAAAGAGADSLANANPVKAAVLDLMTEDEARHAFDSLSGETHATARTALDEDARLPRNAVLDRLADAEAGSGVWGQAFGNWGENGGDGNAATLKRNSKGIIAGADLALGGTRLRLGIAGGYTDSDLHADARASNGSITTTHALAYLGGDWGGFRLRLGGGYAASKVDTSRSVAFTGFTDSLHARYDAHTLQGFGEIGYRLPVGTGWIEPFAGVAAVRVSGDGVTEVGGPAALTIGKSRFTDKFSTAGLKGSTAIAGPFVAGFSLGWQHRFEDGLAPATTMRFATGTPFTILGAPLAKDQATAELSAGWRITPRTVLRASYSGTLGGRTSDSAARLSLSIGF